MTNEKTLELIRQDHRETKRRIKNLENDFRNVNWDTFSTVIATIYGLLTQENKTVFIALITVVLEAGATLPMNMNKVKENDRGDEIKRNLIFLYQNTRLLHWLDILQYDMLD